MTIQNKRLNLIHKLINLYLGVRAAIIAIYKKTAAWAKKSKVSPITRYLCDNMLLEAAKKTALYALAKKDIMHMWNESLGILGFVGHGEERKANIVKPVTIGGEPTYRSLPPGWGHVFPWPDGFVLYTVEQHGNAITSGLDGVIVDQIVSHTTADERITFKKCLTKDVMEKALYHRDKEVIKNGSKADFYWDSDGAYLICVTSLNRIETDAFTRDGAGWEDVEIYGDYFDRKLYPGEYGRLKLADRLYVVFLTTLDDRMQFNLVFGPDALTVPPLEDNINAIFRRTPDGEIGLQPRGWDVGYRFKIGAVADKSKCVVLEATHRVGGKG
ncbi:MAG: hypothetical protein WC374_04805 [Phycisphaerae bacterium]|jgi:hypothetical protein